MDRFNIPLVAEGLTAYAIEWQNGFERSSPSPYAPTWAETRRFWTDAILQGMARLEGREPDPALMEQFDRQLEQARGCFATIPASLRLQKETVRGLYDEASRQYPEISEWPALCMIYAGGNQENALGTIDATEFDLRIMNQAGDRFLNRPGIRWLGGPYELTVSAGPAMTQMQM